MGEVRLSRVHQGEEATIYDGSDGAKWILKPVDREYQGRNKPPRYYLLRQAPGASKPAYISGLFETKRERVLSGDQQDPIGVRRMFTVTVEGQGEAVTIQPGRADK